MGWIGSEETKNENAATMDAATAVRDDAEDAAAAAGGAAGTQDTAAAMRDTEVAAAAAAAVRDDAVHGGGVAAAMRDDAESADAEGDDAAGADAAGGAAEMQDAPAPIVRMKKRVAFVGNTGSGKSTLANLILGRPAFEVSDGMRGTTRMAQIEENDKYIFVDTQGLLDPEDSQIIVRSNIVEGLKMLGKVDIILLLIPFGKYNVAIHEANTFLTKAVLGDEAYNNMIVIITHTPWNYVRDENEANKYIAEKCLPHRNFKDLYRRTNGRVLFVSSPHVSSDPEEEALFARQRALSLSRVTQALDQMNAPPIMDEEFRKAQEKYDQDLNRLNKEKMQLQAELEEAILAKARQDMQKLTEEQMRLMDEKEKARIAKGQEDMKRLAEEQKRSEAAIASRKEAAEKEFAEKFKILEEQKRLIAEKEKAILAKGQKDMRRVVEMQKRLEAEKEADIIAKGREAAEKEFAEKLLILERHRAESDKRFAEQMAALSWAALSWAAVNTGNGKPDCPVS